jgi:hypothetical protein
MLDKS